MADLKIFQAYGWERCLAPKADTYINFLFVFIHVALFDGKQGWGETRAHSKPTSRPLEVFEILKFLKNVQLAYNWKSHSVLIVVYNYFFRFLYFLMVDIELTIYPWLYDISINHPLPLPGHRHWNSWSHQRHTSQTIYPGVRNPCDIGQAKRGKS